MTFDFNKMTCSEILSRRGLFRNAVMLAAGMIGVLGMGAPAQAKMTQKAAGYQDTPKADQKCSGCALFKTPNSCTLIDGSISPDGWCRFYAKKAS